tara:strand:- start:501 stop:665 length:165 start_codon:yes stop_codon:yes gene_type:complete
MSDRIIDIIVRVTNILIVFAGFHLMKSELGFETVVLLAIALTLVELYANQNKDE